MTSPVWLALYRDRAPVYVAARSVGQARKRLPARPERIIYAGFNADPDSREDLDSQRTATEDGRRAKTRRAEKALALYAALRADFPVRSILARFKVNLISEATVRDWVAEIGRRLSYLDQAHLLPLIDVVQAQYLAHRHAAIARTSADGDRDYNAERSRFYAERAARLRKRADYRAAVEAFEATSTLDLEPVVIILEAAGITDAREVAGRLGWIGTPFR